MNVLTLDDLPYHTDHRYYENEQIEGNQFEVDLVFGAGLEKTARTDCLDKMINYERANKWLAR